MVVPRYMLDGPLAASAEVPAPARAGVWPAALSRAEIWPLAVVLVVAGATRVIWWMFRLPPFIDPDSVGYFVPGYDLVTGGQLSLGLRRTPGYPLFCAAVLAISGTNSLYPLLAMQHLVGWCTAGVSYILGRVLFGRPTAFLAGLLVALDGGLLLFEHTLMTEVHFAFWLTLTSLLLVLGLRTGRPPVFALGGLALGLLSLVRPSGQLLLVPPLIACLLVLKSRRWTCAALLVGAFLAVVAPWIVRNWAQFGVPALAGSGRFLIHRTLTDDNLFAMWAASGRMPAGDPQRQAALQILVQEDRRAEPESVTQRFRRELGLTEEQQESLMRELAIGAIGANPVHYVRTTIWMAYEVVADRPLEISEYWHGYRDVGWPPRLDFILPPQRKEYLSAAQPLLSLVDPGRYGPALAVLFLAGAVGAWRERRSRLWLVPASLVALGVFSTAALAGIEWRFRFGFDSLLLIGGAAGLTSIVQAGVSRVLRGSRVAQARPAHHSDGSSAAGR